MSMAATISLLAAIPNSPLLKPEKKAFDTWQQIDSGKDPIREKKKKREKQTKSD